MTEEQWLSCTDPTVMLEYLRGKGERPEVTALFAVVCSPDSIPSSRPPRRPHT